MAIDKNAWLKAFQGVKEMDIWKKETLCCFHEDDLEFEMYMLDEEGDERTSAIWMRITFFEGDGIGKNLEFPVNPENINHLVAAIKKARMIIKDQWHEKKEENKKPDAVDRFLDLDYDEDDEP